MLIAIAETVERPYRPCCKGGDSLALGNDFAKGVDTPISIMVNHDSLYDASSSFAGFFKLAARSMSPEN